MAVTPDLKAGAAAHSAASHGESGPRRYLPGIAVLVAIFAWLMLRNYGLVPTIFADEWYYSRLARLQPLSEAVLPSYLYLWLFRGTSMCGDGFLDCARGLNTLFWVGAAPFIYFTARVYTTRSMAATLALLSTLVPLNMYTAFFMPECTYYFGFSVLSWIVLTRTNWPWLKYALVCGFVLGVMSLIKVHAVFLVPALGLFLLYKRWLAGGAWLVEGVASMAISAVVFFAVRFGIGYLMAGPAALNLFGPFYGGGATNASHGSMLRLLLPASISLRGHLMLMAVISALPMAIVAQSLLRPAGRATATPSDVLRIWVLLTLGAAAGMTVIYTSTLWSPGSIEGYRLHLRYYSFVFPMLWLATIAPAAAIEAPGAREKTAWLRWTLALLLIGMLVWAALRLPTFTINPVDTPEGAALHMDKPTGRLVALLEAVILLMWAAGKVSARRLFIFGVLPAMVLAGVFTNHRFLGYRQAPLAGDLGGRFVRHFVPDAERSQVTVMGTGPDQWMRAQFHIDSPITTTLDVPWDVPVEPYHLPIRNKWLLVLGKHPLPPGLKPVAATPDYALIRMEDHNRLLAKASLTEPFGKGLIASAEGLSIPEPFGRWSDAQRIVLHLNTPLPRRLNLVIKGWAFGANINELFTVHVGNASAQFRVGGTVEDTGVRIETDGNQRDIVIDVPHPQSPQELGSPGDPRKLGLAMAEIEILTPDN